MSKADALALVIGVLLLAFLVALVLVLVILGRLAWRSVRPVSRPGAQAPLPPPPDSYDLSYWIADQARAMTERAVVARGPGWHPMVDEDRAVPVTDGVVVSGPPLRVVEEASSGDVVAILSVCFTCGVPVLATPSEVERGPVCQGCSP